MLFQNKDSFGNHSPLVTLEYLETVRKHINIINENIDYKRDYLFDFFGIKTLERAYLIRLKSNKFNDSNIQNSKGDKDWF